MGSAAFLNEAINQLAEAYISRKEKETGEIISYEKRFNELQKVKMFIADRNVYGIDLNPVAVELAEVSLWLNTIYEGGFVPWFGTQLVNGNSLIGARRQVYRIDNAQSTSKGMRWYEMEPERLPFGTARADKGYKFGRKQIYHFLLGDPGMCSYSDKVIKSLEPDKIKEMVKWNKKFTEPITDDDVITLLRLSAAIDELWEAQIRLRKEIGAKTQDVLSIFGHTDDAVDSHTTIRQKDKIYSELYKSEHMRNAGPYARLKFAMDYWCALWFWPIDKADLLPTRSEFLFDMSLILEGTMASVNVTDSVKGGQLSLFPTEMEQMALDIIDIYGTDTIVDIPRLRQENPRLDLAVKIAEQNKFMHWELEFADLFAERGGFDLIIGNPPWVKVEWNEQGVLADANPIFAIKKLNASETAELRTLSLTEGTRKLYFAECESMLGQQNFYGAMQNYPLLKGTPANLFKCFLPQSWSYGHSDAVAAFVHPEGVYNAPNGGELRRTLYKKLRYHFQFVNQFKLFDIGNTRTYSLNVYSNKATGRFDSISNLYAPATIDECYDGVSRPLMGIKDQESNWNTVGTKERIVRVNKNSLTLFAKVFDDSDDWATARLPIIHATPYIEVLELLSNQHKLSEIEHETYITEMWHETGAQKNGTICIDVGFPEAAQNLIYNGPLIGLSNPMFKAAQRVCNTHRAFDNVDLTAINVDYLPRCKFNIKCSGSEYVRRIPVTPWGTPCNAKTRIIMRNMFDLVGERTLMSAIAPPASGHVHAVLECSFADVKKMVLFQAGMSSLVVDFYIKVLGKDSGGINVLRTLPILSGKYENALIVRALRLNCVTNHYKQLWAECWDDDFAKDQWSKEDHRLDSKSFSKLTGDWCKTSALRSDFERRQALVEIDVLTAMAVGMNLKQLISIYRLQFNLMQQYESGTWYDTNGRTVFSSKNMGELTYKRPEWEKAVKDAPAGKKFYRTITDDTMPGGPIERTIEYVAPFDRCDREKDYEIAWKFFEEKYGK